MAQRDGETEPKPEMVYFPVNVSGLPMNQESYKRMWDFYYEKYHYSGTPPSGRIQILTDILATKKNKLKREIEEKSRNVEKKRRVPVPPTYRTRKFKISPQPVELEIGQLRHFFRYRNAAVKSQFR